MGDKIKSKFQYNNCQTVAVTKPLPTPRLKKPSRRCQTRELVANGNDPFASDHDWSDASSILSQYEFYPKMFPNLIDNQDSMTDSPPPSVTSSESEIVEIEEDEESIY